MDFILSGIVVVVGVAIAGAAYVAFLVLRGRK